MCSIHTSTVHSRSYQHYHTEWLLIIQCPRWLAVGRLCSASLPTHYRVCYCLLSAPLVDPYVHSATWSTTQSPSLPLHSSRSLSFTQQCVSTRLIPLPLLVATARIVLPLVTMSTYVLLVLAVVLITLQCGSVHASLQLTPYAVGGPCNVTNNSLPAITLPDWQFNISAPCVPYTATNTLFPGLAPSWLAINCGRVGIPPRVLLYYYSVEGGCPAMSAGFGANFSYFAGRSGQCDVLHWQEQRGTLRLTGTAMTIMRCDGNTTDASPPHQSDASLRAAVASAWLFALLVSVAFASL